MLTGVNATIFIPEEIPSLLSVVYSNLPPIKKGNDRRLNNKIKKSEKKKKQNKTITEKRKNLIRVA